MGAVLEGPRIDDKDHRLDLITNMQFVRWMEPGTIELVRRFEEGLPGEAKPSGVRRVEILPGR